MSCRYFYRWIERSTITDPTAYTVWKIWKWISGLNIFWNKLKLRFSDFNFIRFSLFEIFGEYLVYLSFTSGTWGIGCNYFKKITGCTTWGLCAFALGNIFLKNSPQCRILVSKEFHRVSLNIQIYINAFRIFWKF